MLVGHDGPAGVRGPAGRRHFLQQRIRQGPRRHGGHHHGVVRDQQDFGAGQLELLHGRFAQDDRHGQRADQRAAVRGGHRDGDHAVNPAVVTDHTRHGLAREGLRPEPGGFLRQLFQVGGRGTPAAGDVLLMVVEIQQGRMVLGRILQDAEEQAVDRAPVAQLRRHLEPRLLRHAAVALEDVARTVVERLEEHGLGGGEGLPRLVLHLALHVVVDDPERDHGQEHEKAEHGDQHLGLQAEPEFFVRRRHGQGLGNASRPSTKSTDTSPSAGTMISFVALGSRSCHARSL